MIETAILVLIGVILFLFAVRVIKYTIQKLYKYAPFIVIWTLIFLAIMYYQ